MTDAMNSHGMTLLTLKTLILWVSFADTALRFIRLHKQSTLLRIYPPKGNILTLWSSMDNTLVCAQYLRNNCGRVLPDSDFFILSLLGYVFKLLRIHI